MSSSDFPQFPDLAAELRAIIWTEAELLENLPPPYDPNDPGFAKYMDYEPLVDCPPIIATCCEARQATIRYFHEASGRSSRRYRYLPARLLRLGELEEHQVREPFGPILLSQPLPAENGDVEERWTPEKRRTTWEISNGRFASPAHLVNVISNFISGGTEVEPLVLDFILGDADPYPDRDTLEDVKFHYIGEMYQSVIDDTILDIAQPPPGAYPVMFISKYRKIRAAAESSIFRDTELKLHLLRIMDLFDASRGRLPRMKHVKVNCTALYFDVEDIEWVPGLDWVMFECKLEGDHVFGWFTRYDGH
ncbi:uncharacterized protein PgNI_09079 [Pyricularia grisea]|uniref:2EXR domain-containing protein n=1 Tax=Pyricularia grisea TaxID=148305 RepID=A0A6P8ARN1_PYRGI|nr:uncharacterized protein PgNI_09079 [Pyricularia grisea]TLD04768.1 hypothetical protein PgNI_09079 [Pyricularia grisea]